MSGSTIGSVVGAGIGALVGGPGGARVGWMIGGTLGGIVKPDQIKGPRLSDGQAVTSQEGIPITFGYGTFPGGGNCIWADVLVEHKHKEGGKGGPVTTTFTYSRSYAIGICEGEITAIAKVWRNGKLVYDITPTSTILGQNSKFLDGHKFYTGSETQLVDPTIEAVVGVGNSPPMRGLAYMVCENEDLTDSGGAIAQWRFVVQMCGTVTETVGENFVSTGQLGFALTSATGEDWTARTGGLSGIRLRFCAASPTHVVANDEAGKFWYSADRGVNWNPSSTSAFSGLQLSEIAYGAGIFVALGWDGVNFVSIVSTDAGLTWVPHTTAIGNVNSIAYGSGLFVLVAQSNIYTSSDGVTWTQRSTASMLAVGWNGTHFMAVGNDGASVTSPDGIAWTAGAATPGGGYFSFGTVTGGPGYFVAGSYGAGAASMGIYRTTDLGDSWTRPLATTANLYSSATGGTSSIIGSGGGGANSQYESQDDGVSWSLISPPIDDTGICYMAPDASWYPVPDAPGVYSDADGNVITDFADGASVSSCGAYLDDIVADLCERAGIEPSEYDVTDLAGTFVKGYACATESSAQGFIEPLTQAFFFDRGEWDKKVRFILRGGASVANLDPDDLVAMDGPAIVQTRVQEVELLRKVNVMTVDPDAEFNVTKQSWERRVGTIQAKGEASVEIPIVTDHDTAAQIAEKRGKVAWAETDKFAYGLTLAHSALTPTDIVTLTDKQGVAHRQRLQAENEQGGVITIEEAMKDRASTYVGTASGVQNPNLPVGSNEELIGATLFAAVALPMLRSQDNTPGLYVGLAGMLDGWPGAQLLMSVDGGVSYSAALTVVEPTIMGELTADEDSNGEPLQVRVFGTLESKTTAQVDVGANWSAIETAGVAEIVAYETATPTGARTYDLTDVTRALDETDYASHSAGDPFMDLSTAYFLPISAEPGTLYFKAVGLGVSPDAVAPVAVTWAGVEYVEDGGEIT